MEIIETIDEETKEDIGRLVEDYVCTLIDRDVSLDRRREIRQQLLESFTEYELDSMLERVAEGKSLYPYKFMDKFVKVEPSKDKPNKKTNEHKRSNRKS